VPNFAKNRQRQHYCARLPGGRATARVMSSPGVNDMSRAGKIVIAIVIAFIFVVAGAISAGVYWISRHGHEVFEAGEKAMNEGQEFGKKSDQQGCVDEAVSRYKANRGFGGALSASMFVRSCLDESRPTPGFCDNVPKPTDVFRSARWQIEEARKAGIADNFGQQIFSQVQNHCQSRESKSK